MLFLSQSGIILYTYIKKCNFHIKDFYEANLKFIATKNLDINDCKYMVLKEGNNLHNSLRLFLVHDIEYKESEKYRLYIQQYFSLNSEENVRQCLEMLEVDNLRRSQLINMETAHQHTKLIESNFKPFITASLVDIPPQKNRDVSKYISESIRNSFKRDSIELKNKSALIFKNKAIFDDHSRFVIKKGIQFYTVLDLDEDDTTWINFNYTNLSRTVDSIHNIPLPEPINHRDNKILNIYSGSRLPTRVKNKSDIKNINNFYLTFSNSEAYEKKYGILRFSQQKFYFEQTNLSDTVEMINELRNIARDQSFFKNCSNLNNVKFKYKIIHRRKKFLLAEEQRFYTPQKGLHHVGVIQPPRSMKMQIIIYQNLIKTPGLNEIINQVNGRIKFLYKESVSLVNKEDVFIFDYNNFEQSVPVKQDTCYLVVLVKPEHSSGVSPKIDLIDKVNNELINFIKGKMACFQIINGINDQYAVANAILKLGLKRKAIPWKIDAVDTNDSNHIFVGIDLGHDHKKKKSKLTFVAVNNQGCLISYAHRDDLPLREQLPRKIIQECLKELIKKIKKKIPKLTINNLTIHRDGILQEAETDYFKEIIPRLGIQQFNLVEIVKSGTPLIGFCSEVNGNTRYIDGFEGYYVYINNISYLITNDQSLDTQTAPEPICIKKIYGYKSITQITDEVFWLTKPYSINIFRPSKLPITTLLANNFSYSRDLIHFTTA